MGPLSILLLLVVAATGSDGSNRGLSGRAGLDDVIRGGRAAFMSPPGGRSSLNFQSSYLRASQRLHRKPWASTRKLRGSKFRRGGRFRKGKDASTAYSPPIFPKEHVVSGIMFLPFSKLIEPFTAYFDGKNKRSRTDFFHGETIHLDSLKPPSIAYRVVWMPNPISRVPERRCLKTREADVRPFLPDLSRFKFVRVEPCKTDALMRVEDESAMCVRFEKLSRQLNRTTKYIFWTLLKDDGDYSTPVRLYMHGYNFIFNSHFDKYEISYNKYTPGPVDDHVFQLDTVYQYTNSRPCNRYSDLPTIQPESPVGDVIEGDESLLNERFEKFKATYNKMYVDSYEEALRKMQFRHSLRLINSMNRRNLSYELEVNPMADMSDAELRHMTGYIRTPRPMLLEVETLAGPELFREKFAGQTRPDSIDWRSLGAVTPVQDQAACGACWAFSAIGALEGAYFRKTGNLVKLPEQQLLDCAWGDSIGCEGGFIPSTFNYVKLYGLASEKNYGTYRGDSGKCREKQTKSTIKTIKGLTEIHGKESILNALAFVGPISIVMNAGSFKFRFYSKGIFVDPDCDPLQPDHALVAVGYGVENGHHYAIVKNSWSTNWGDDGYFKISLDDNTCGINNGATFVEL